MRLTAAGRELRQESLTIPVTLGANLQQDAEVEVAVENGDDAPLPLTGVRLQMRQRKLCFPKPAGGGLTLFYGDAALKAPVYDFARVLALGSGMGVALLGSEEANPGYTPRPVVLRSVTERHPELVWVGLLLVVCVLGAVAIHSARRVGG